MTEVSGLVWLSSALPIMLWRSGKQTEFFGDATCCLKVIGIIICINLILHLHLEVIVLISQVTKVAEHGILDFFIYDAEHFQVLIRQ